MKKGNKMMKRELILFLLLCLFAVTLTFTGCVNATKYQTNIVHCEALTIILYRDILTEKSDEEILINNAVIEEVYYGSQ